MVVGVIDCVGMLIDLIGNIYRKMFLGVIFIIKYWKSRLVSLSLCGNMNWLAGGLVVVGILSRKCTGRLRGVSYIGSTLRFRTFSGEVTGLVAFMA